MNDASNKGLIDSTKLLRKFGNSANKSKSSTIEVTGDGVKFDLNWFYA